MDNHTLGVVIAILRKSLNGITDDIAQNVTDWLDEHVDPETGYVIDNTLTIQGAAADAKAVGDAIEDIISTKVLTNAQKIAILACFRNVAWINDQGQTYYRDLQNAFNISVTSISAVFDAQGNTIYVDEGLEALKQYLTVTATYDDGTSGVINNYELSGTLAEGLNVITVEYFGVTTTFEVANVVDFYNIWVWDSSTSEHMIRISEAATGYDRGASYTYRYKPAISQDNPNLTRSGFYVDRGKINTNVVYQLTGALADDTFLIPVPATSEKVTFTLTPSTQYASVRSWTYVGNGEWEREPETGWQTGTYTLVFTDKRENRYISINCKAAADGTIHYNDSTYPRPSVHIEFS